MQAEVRLVDAELTRLRSEIKALDGELDLHDVAFYRPRYDFATSERYRSELERVRTAQKALIKTKQAAVGHIECNVNNSRTEGRKQINQTIKLMFRAFNGECDAGGA